MHFQYVLKHFHRNCGSVVFVSFYGHNNRAVRIWQPCALHVSVSLSLLACHMCFHASEKLLSDTAVPLFPSYTPSLAQLPLAARSHDPPTALPSFTFSLAFLASEKQRPAPSPTPDSAIVHCWQPGECIAKRVASSRSLGQNLARQIVAKRKDKPVFPPPSSLLHHCYCFLD